MFGFIQIKIDESERLIGVNMITRSIFSQSVSLTQYVVLSVCLSACTFQLASELSHNVVARRRSDYCPRGAIFYSYIVYFVHYSKITQKGHLGIIAFLSSCLLLAKILVPIKFYMGLPPSPYHNVRNLP